MIDSISLRTKLNIDHNYSIISDIPSKFRSYGKSMSTIYVRDLMFDEIKALSLYLDKDYDLNQLITIYSDVIKITTTDGTQFDLQNLELVDFHYLVIVSSILTESEAAWNVTRECNACINTLEAKFYYSEIEYSLTEDLAFPIKLIGTENFINPALVKDYITLLPDNIDKLTKQYDLKIDKRSLKELLSYATSLNYTNSDDLIQNLNLLNSNPNLIKIVRGIAKESMVSIKPFSHVCNKCGAVNKFQYDFSVIRGYL